MLGIILGHSSNLFIEPSSFSQTQNSALWLISVASLLWGLSCFFLLRLESRAHSAYTWALGI